MAIRHDIPPKVDKEIIALGLTLPQLLWAVAGLVIMFAGFSMWSKVTDSTGVALVSAIPPGLIVLPFVFYKPKDGSLTFTQFIRYKWEISNRNNELPNMRLRQKAHNKDKTILSTDDTQIKKSVKDIDITLGGGR